MKIDLWMCMHMHALWSKSNISKQLTHAGKAKTWPSPNSIEDVVDNQL